MKIRFATTSDASQMLQILSPVVETTAISFLTAPPSEAEFANKIQTVSARYPWLVCENAGKIVGYAYASQHRGLGAFQWSVETAIYVSPAAQKKGIATELYQKLFQILRAQSFYTAYAGITLPNAASVRLHEKLGFEQFCIYGSVGFKLGKWRDMGWWKLALQKDYAIAPSEPLSIVELCKQQHLQVSQILDGGKHD